MPSVGAQAQAAQQELKRVLESPGFGRNERLSRFLRLVVERHLEGRDHELKCSVIGNEIFGRRPDYNPKNDAIVRTEARRLRALLNEYYLGDGKGDALVIDLPKGGYVPTLTEPRASASGLRGSQRNKTLVMRRAGVGSRWLVVPSPKCACSHRGSAPGQLESGFSRRLLCRWPHRRDHPQPVHH
jgi:hypothetical protein